LSFIVESYGETSVKNILRSYETLCNEIEDSKMSLEKRIKRDWLLESEELSN
jgi:bisphosphoglycerate-dependent phosphoglycerate mutase